MYILSFLCVSSFPIHQGTWLASAQSTPAVAGSSCGVPGIPRWSSPSSPESLSSWLVVYLPLWENINVGITDNNNKPPIWEW